MSALLRLDPHLALLGSPSTLPPMPGSSAVRVPFDRCVHHVCHKLSLEIGFFNASAACRVFGTCDLIFG
eukprot:m.259931 g.259931  ORF g.259931 m.259931 type:complete len:69 (-) comp15981_c0_seq1:266-472(-)